MLTRTHSRRRLRGLAAAAAISSVMLVPANVAVAADATTAELDGADTELSVAGTSVHELRTLVDDLSVANETLQADNLSLQRNIDSLSRERDRLQDSLAGFESLYDPLEADRKLLVELRKSPPDTRPEAEAQLQRLRDLALSADPATLGQLIDRVDDAAPAFLDWRFTQFASAQEATQAYVSSGANAFDSSMNEFRNGVLLSVANRLDGLLTTLDRIN